MELLDTLYVVSWVEDCGDIELEDYNEFDTYQDAMDYFNSIRETRKGDVLSANLTRVETNWSDYEEQTTLHEIDF